MARKLGADLTGFEQFESLPADERQAIFQIAAARLGLPGTNIEKDYWVCRVLAIMMRTPPFMPKRFFKGGTSLSKGFDLIRRFSEDIDVVLARSGLLNGAPDPFDLETKFESKKRRERAQGDVFKSARTYICEALAARILACCPDVELSSGSGDIRQPVLFVAYPSVYPVQEGAEEYNKRRVKIESGPRGAKEPSVDRTIKPYVADDLAGRIDLSIDKVSMIRPERTFLEKISAIHSINRRFQNDGRIPAGLNPPSRHYYDVAVMLDHGVGREAINDADLTKRVCADTTATFGSTHATEITEGNCSLVPEGALLAFLVEDYGRMRGMMHGDPPRWNWIVQQVTAAQNLINEAMTPVD